MAGAIPTRVAGYQDRQHFFAGAPIFSINMKLALAATLVVLLTVTVAGVIHGNQKIFVTTIWQRIHARRT